MNICKCLFIDCVLIAFLCYLNGVSFLLQYLEATVVVHGVCGKLGAMGVPVQPLHDGILIPQENLDVAKQVLISECSKFVGSSPFLHEKVLGNDKTDKVTVPKHSKAPWSIAKHGGQKDARDSQATGELKMP